MTAKRVDNADEPQMADILAAVRRIVSNRELSLPPDETIAAATAPVMPSAQAGPPSPSVAENTARTAPVGEPGTRYESSKPDTGSEADPVLRISTQPMMPPLPVLQERTSNEAAHALAAPATQADIKAAILGLMPDSSNSLSASSLAPAPVMPSGPQANDDSIRDDVLELRRRPTAAGSESKHRTTILDLKDPVGRAGTADGVEHADEAVAFSRLMNEWLSAGGEERLRQIIRDELRRSAE